MGKESIYRTSGKSTSLSFGICPFSPFFREYRKKKGNNKTWLLPMIRGFWRESNFCINVMKNFSELLSNRCFKFICSNCKSKYFFWHYDDKKFISPIKLYFPSVNISVWLKLESFPISEWYKEPRWLPYREVNQNSYSCGWWVTWVHAWSSNALGSIHM